MLIHCLLIHSSVCSVGNACSVHPLFTDSFVPSIMHSFIRLSVCLLHAVRCCAVLCCAVLCCAVLCVLLHPLWATLARSMFHDGNGIANINVFLPVTLTMPFPSWKTLLARLAYKGSSSSRAGWSTRALTPTLVARERLLANSIALAVRRLASWQQAGRAFGQSAKLFHHQGKMARQKPCCCHQTRSQTSC